MADIPHIRFSRVSKSFGHVKAVNAITLEIRPGEIHALLGQNGAGKTTLAKMLVGLYSPDEGEILIDGEPISHRNPREALERGIGMVFQTSSLVRSLTVAENIVLAGSFSGISFARQRFPKTTSSGYQLSVDPHILVNQLTEGERQRVEIFRALLQGAKILILDEPNSSLTPLESEALFRECQLLRQRGTTIILITHRLSDVLTHADRISVLRDGQCVATVTAQDLPPSHLTRMLVNADIPALKKVTMPDRSGPPVLHFDSVSTPPDPHAGQHLDDLSFLVHPGEILGIAGVSGNGQRAITDMLVGGLPPKIGQLLFCGYPYHFGQSRKSIAYIPDDSIEEGVAGGLSVGTNLLLADLGTAPYSVFGFVQRRVVNQEIQRRIDSFDIHPPKHHIKACLLSGGNLRKLILAREFAHTPQLIIAVNPTAGLDIKATNLVHDTLLRRAADRSAILLISHDLDEIATLSDRILVLHRGRSASVINRASYNSHIVGALMAGISASEAELQPCQNSA